MTLIYLPLESYKERYTEQLSAPKTGWDERYLTKTGIDYIRVDGVEGKGEKFIEAGVVLDATRRCKYAMSQISQLLTLLKAGKITNEDIIYFSDFWHPGIESLAYSFHIHKIKPKIFSFLYAQSVDCFDFTYPMRQWMRHFETGIGSIMTGIFTSCPTLAKLVSAGMIAVPEKIHPVGLIFSSEEVKERMPPITETRNNTVVWSSRWDKEKNPGFFMSVAEYLLKQRSDINFKVCTGAQRLRSNVPSLVDRAYNLQSEYPNRFHILENLTKEQYYQELALAKVQFNCAFQDFVSFTLLEASVAGCYPIYPDFRAFPETFLNKEEFLYRPLNIQEATSKISSIIDRDDLWTDEERQKRAWIHTRFDSTWKRMDEIMNEKEPTTSAF